MKKIIVGLMLLFTTAFATSSFAHCEIPCGIYDDSLRVALIYEHITTIEKSMAMITKLESAEVIDYNQLVRWVMNKEEHAQKIQEIISQYFMHQRIKPAHDIDKEKYDKYVGLLTLSHQISVYAMKAKQTTDKSYIAKMRETLHQFEHAYFGGEHKH